MGGVDGWGDTTGQTHNHSKSPKQKREAAARRLSHKATQKDGTTGTPANIQECVHSPKQFSNPGTNLLI